MKKREGSRWIKERKNKRGKLLCLIPTCNNLREKYKKSDKLRNYCKKHGYDDMRPFTSWQALREEAFKRDNFTCVKCGDNRKEVEVTIKYRRITNWEYIMQKPEKIPGKFKYENAERKETRNNFIGDHIISIALGGEEFDLDNVQTLCIKCNKLKTAKDLTKIAKFRKRDIFQRPRM